MALAPDGIEAGRDLAGIQGLLVQGGEDALGLGGVEGRAGALAAHVGDEERQATVRQGEQVVVVAGHFPRGQDGGPHRGQVQGLQVRQEAHLDLAGHPELLLHAQALLPLGVGLLQPAGHGVEGGRERRHLVPPPGPDAHGEVTGAEPRNAPEEAVHGLPQLPGQVEPHDQRHQLEGEEDEDAHHQPADDEEGLAGEVAALGSVAEAPEELLQVRLRGGAEEHGPARLPVDHPQAHGGEAEGAEEAAALGHLAVLVGGDRRGTAEQA